MRKLRYLIPLLVIVFLSLTYSDATAQYENTSGQKKEGDVKKRPKPQKPKRFFAGGMIGAGFSSYSSYVELAPIFGYKVTPDFHVGTRINYIFNSYQVWNPATNTEQRVQLHHYGIGVFARYIFFKGIYGHVEYEALSFDYYYADRNWINSLFIGGGFMQNIGGSGFATFAILFNVLDSPDSPYVNPIIRIGFGAGF